MLVHKLYPSISNFHSPGFYVCIKKQNVIQSSNPSILSSQPPVPVTEDVRKNQITSTLSSPLEPIDVRSENLFQRTEVLAGMYGNSSTGVHLFHTRRRLRCAVFTPVSTHLNVDYGS